MKVPNARPKSPGEFIVRCQRPFGGGRAGRIASPWFLYDDTGKVVISGGLMICLDRLDQLRNEASKASS